VSCSIDCRKDYPKRGIMMVCEKAVEVFSLISPIGEMIMKICPQGLHSLSQCDYICDTNFHPQKG
jgi:hypothetical protein